MRTHGSRLDEASLTVLLDLRNPQSYLALPPAMELARELQIDVNWLPLTAPPLRPPSLPSPEDDRGTLHRRHRARAIAREIEVYGRAQGLVLRDPYRDPDSTAFVLGWLWLRERDGELPAYLVECFRAYWSLELDPSSLRSVRERVASVGGDAGAFEEWSALEGPQAASEVADDLRERGIFGVPGYLVDGEYLMGRQHLPMIRWILCGRIGAGPI